MENINYFDIAILVILLVLGIKGMLSGLVRELFGLLGVGVGVYFASMYSETLGALLTDTLLSGQSKVLAKLLAFIILLIVIWGTLVILGNLLSKLSALSGLGFFDRLFGFIFGGGKVFLILAIIVYSLSNIEIIREKTREIFKNSIAYEAMYDVGKIIVNIDTSKLQNKISETLENNSTKEND